MRRRSRKADRKTLVAVLVILTSGIVVSYFVGLGWSPTRATLILRLSNETDLPMVNVTNPMYLYLPSRFNLTALPETPPNITITVVFAGSLIHVSNNISYTVKIYAEQIGIAYLAARSTISLELGSIYPVAIDYSDLSAENINVQLMNVPSGVAYSLQFVVLRDTVIGPLSMGSSYVQWAGGIRTIPSDLTDRFNAHLLYYALAAMIILTLLGILLAWNPELVRRYPFTTFLIASASLFLYVFIGSGWEVDTSFNLAMLPLHILPIVGPLIHASYSHITGNLPLFLIIGVVSEWVASAGVTNIKQNKSRFAIFFLLPLLLSSSGYGLSGVIEMMVVFLFAYALVNRQTIARSSWMTGAVFVSGLTLIIFYNWLTYAIGQLISVLQMSPSVASALAQYETRLALLHIAFTVAAVVLVWLLWKYRRNFFSLHSNSQQNLNEDTSGKQ